MDSKYNTDISVSSNVHVRSSDLWDVEPATQTLENGTTVFTLTLVSASTATQLIAVHTGGGNPLLSDTTESVSVAVSTITGLYKLQVLLPGEQSAPGKSPYDGNPASGGKQGSVRP